MAGGVIDSLLIAIGLDTKGISEGVQKVGAELDSGLSQAAQNAATKMSPLGEALKDLGEQAKGARESVEQIPPALDNAASKVKGTFSGIWSQIVGPLAGAFALGGTISSYISNSIGAGELAERLKVDVEEIQIWSGAMDRAGGSASALQTTIQKLTASGKDNGDVFGTLMGLAEQAETMSKEAFYAKAKELEIDEKTIEVLAQGRKALDEHLKRQKELGVYTKEDAENSKKFKQSLADLLQAWDGLTSFIGRLAVPVMKLLADILTNIVVFLRQHTPFVVAAIGLVGVALAYRLMPPLRELPKLIMGISRAFMRWFPIIAVIAGIALVIDDLYAYLSGGKSQFAEFWSIFGSGPEIMEKLKTSWKDLKQWGQDVFNGLVEDVKALWAILEDTGAVDGFKAALLGLGHLIHGIFTDSQKEAEQGAEQMLTGIWNMISGVLGRILGAVGDMFSDMWSEATEGAAEGLSRLGTEIWNWITGIVDQISDFVSEKISGLLDIKLPSFSDLLGGAGDAAKTAGDALGGAAKGALSLGEQAAGALKEGIGKAGDILGTLFQDAGPKTEEAGATVKAGMAQAAGAVKEGFDSAWRATAGFAVQTFQGAASTIQQIFSGIVSGIETQVGTLVAGAQRMALQAGMVPAAAGVRAQNAGRGGVTVNQSNRINVDARGGDPARVQQGVQRGLDPSRTARAAASGTVQKG